MQEEIEIPLDLPYRRHLSILYTFVLVHITAVETEDIPTIGIENFVKKEWINKMISLLQEHPDNEIPIELKDVISTFACHHIMNRILVSDFDSVLTKRFLDRVSEGHHLKKLEDFRSNMIATNNALLKNFQRFYEYTNAFFELEKGFQAWEF